MDISDRNFKPCPCGYQICQFCYNNIRQNPELNGRCPGCRRLYDDESVEYKQLTPEEYRVQQAKKEKREREKKQREKERKELEIASKRHLAGLRVVQKNLVYVTGLNPPCAAEELHLVLRLERYFGQYGKISKIVINRKNLSASSIVVYVTFARKEDALRCIGELDGSLCDGRVLRAAHGTTKYCLLYLRGHPCPNPNCMFLHEPGEEADLYTRKDLLTHQGIKMGMSGRRGSGHMGYEEEGLVLPASAHWASEAALSGAGHVAAPLSAAFPTLGESKEHKHKKEAKKPRRRDADELFADDMADRLRTLADLKHQLRVFFDNVGELLPLFHYDPAPCAPGDRQATRDVIERFVLRPIKKYHLAYNHSRTQARLQQVLLDEKPATPPPGLFARETPQMPAMQTQSSSSQLLTQLMSGKK